MKLSILLFAGYAFASAYLGATPDVKTLIRRAETDHRTICDVEPNGIGGDDAPAIAAALNGKCRENSLVLLRGSMYYIKSNMTTMDMNDVVIALTGTMAWSPDIPYWLSVSMPIGFQNQSTVWFFGGNKVRFDGYNMGVLDGNGQAWYNWAKSRGNLPRRPMNINFRRLTNSVVKRLRFKQSQMWTMAVSNSQNVDFDDIHINSTSNTKWNTLNTDGCDTIDSDSITFRRWFVANGDDAIALKRNSTNIAVYDSEFHNGQGIAIGSTGQYDNRYEYLTNFYARNITFVNTAHVSYLKTWAGVSRGYPPNGGGGGLGHASNITIEDVTVKNLREQPFFAWQCENYSGFAGKDCNSSKFKLYDVVWRNVSGTVNYNVLDIASLRCSAAADGCAGIEISNVSLKKEGSGDTLDSYYCENVVDPKGFTCNDSTSSPH